MLEIDGAAFSGSGMIVRQAVAYAGVTGTPIHVRNVRARRPHPGLRPQHVCAVEAVRDLVGGTVDEARVGGGEFAFTPAGQRPRGGYRFDVGTAGSATALSLALLPVLATSGDPVRVDLTGGLFQDGAPSAFHLQFVLAPLLARMGVTVDASVLRPGYVPAGGGLLRLDVVGRPELAALRAERPGDPLRIWGISLSSHLHHRDVSARMARRARDILRDAGLTAEIDERDDTSAGQRGAALAIFADLPGGWRLGADGAGAIRRTAETVGSTTARRLLDDLHSGANVDRFASDQIVPFAALAAGRTRIRLAEVTDHVRTALWLADLFGLASSRLTDRVLTIDPLPADRTADARARRPLA